MVHYKFYIVLYCIIYYINRTHSTEKKN